MGLTSLIIVSGKDGHGTDSHLATVSLKDISVELLSMESS